MLQNYYDVRAAKSLECNPYTLLAALSLDLDLLSF